MAYIWAYLQPKKMKNKTFYSMIFHYNYKVNKQNPFHNFVFLQQKLQFLATNFEIILYISQSPHMQPSTFFFFFGFLGSINLQKNYHWTCSWSTWSCCEGMFWAYLPWCTYYKLPPFVSSWSPGCRKRLKHRSFRPDRWSYKISTAPLTRTGRRRRRLCSLKMICSSPWWELALRKETR